MNDLQIKDLYFIMGTIPLLEVRYPRPAPAPMTLSASPLFLQCPVLLTTITLLLSSPIACLLPIKPACPLLTTHPPQAYVQRCDNIHNRNLKKYEADVAALNVRILPLISSYPCIPYLFVPHTPAPTLAAPQSLILP